MKVRLIAVDSKIPNYALMKISTYHKRLGDDVDWYNPLFDSENTDILYMSKVFTFTQDYLYLPNNAKIIKGGTGYDIYSKLPDEIENITDLDYSLYPDCDYSIVFMSRGCFRNCPFCIVRKKEGLIHKVQFPKLNPNGKWIMLLDNNFFGCKDWKENINIIKSWNKPVDFTQGIDLRILTEEQCKVISDIKIKGIHCAWDNYEDKDLILPKLKMLCQYVKPYKITCYCLVGFKNKNHILDEDIERVMTLKELGVNPFAMGYIDFENLNYKRKKEINDFCRWVNHKAIFKTISWQDYNKNIKLEKDDQLSLF